MKTDHERLGKGWVWLGTFYFNAGTGGYAEISNLSNVSGVIIADAIRFGNGIGDIVRPGPGTISGYPPDEDRSRYWAESEAGNHAVGMPARIGNTDGVRLSARPPRNSARNHHSPPLPSASCSPCAAPVAGGGAFSPPSGMAVVKP